MSITWARPSMRADDSIPAGMREPRRIRVRRFLHQLLCFGHLPVPPEPTGDPVVTHTTYCSRCGQVGWIRG